MKLKIPDIDNPENLSAKDKKNLAKAYYSVYKVYKDKDSSSANDYLKVAKKYDKNIG